MDRQKNQKKKIHIVFLGTIISKSISRILSFVIFVDKQLKARLLKRQHFLHMNFKYSLPKIVKNVICSLSIVVQCIIVHYIPITQLSIRGQGCCCFWSQILLSLLPKHLLMKLWKKLQSLCHKTTVVHILVACFVCWMQMGWGDKDDWLENVD